MTGDERADGSGPNGRETPCPSGEHGNGDVPIRLRGHHLGCTAGFAGHGYDPGFTANLARIAAALSGDPDHPVLVVAGPDDVCGPCPHLVSGTCARDPGAEERVRAHDREFLRALGLRIGDRTTPRDIENRLEGNPEARDRILGACGTCSWTRVCAFHHRAKRP